MFSMKSSRALRSALILSAALAGVVSANERHFGYSYETGVLAPGAKEVEVYSTLRAGRDNYFQALDHRVEFEVGLPANLMTSFYLNLSNTTEEVTPGTLATQFEFEGFSNEWKWKLTDPVADPVGLGLYTELTYNTNGFEIEPKILLDKRLGSWLLVANVIGEFEFEAEPDEMELEEIAPDLTLGGAYEFTKGFYAGLELRNHNAFLKSGDSEDLEHEFSALYFGPVVSYATESWWMTFTVLPQLPALSKESGGSMFVLDDGEYLNARLLFSFHI
jgi:hypothetical protein